MLSIPIDPQAQVCETYLQTYLLRTESMFVEEACRKRRKG